MSDHQDENEARVKLAVEGPASAVDKALKERVGVSANDADNSQDDSPSPAPAPPAKSADDQASPSEDEGDRCQELLADPRNMVTVWRVMPARWLGQKTDVRCGDRWLCPQKFDELVDDVFARFGGKRFKVLIHPNTPKGESKVLDAFEIENPNTAEPLLEGVPYQVLSQGAAAQAAPIAIPTGTSDPTTVPDESPLAATRRAIQEKINALRLKAELKEAEKMLAESYGVGERAREESSELEKLRRELEELKHKREVKDVLEEKLKRLEDSLERLSQKRDENNLTQLLVAQMRHSEERFTKLLETLMARGDKGDLEEKILDKIERYRRVFGQDDSRTKRLEEMAFSILEEKMFGARDSEEGAEDNPTVYAIKQLAPILKDYVERQFPKAESGGLPEAERTRVIAETSRRLAVQMVEDLKRKGWVVRAEPKPQPQPQPASPVSAQKPAPPTLPSEPQETALEPPPPPRSAPKPPVYPVPEALKEIPNMDGIEIDLPGVGKVFRPPSPQSPNYDRKLSVNFVLDSILSEIHQRVPWEKPNDSYVPGDILDNLDDEFLQIFARVESGDELERLLQEYADPGKLERMKQLASNDDTVRKWLRRIVTTTQLEISGER